ncbi:MAG: 50S ribosomal protein L11 methyltransferase [Bauldia sp.]
MQATPRPRRIGAARSSAAAPKPRLTAAATADLPEARARRLAEAVADDERIAAAAVDLSETAADAWQVTVYLDGADADRRTALEDLAAKVAGRESSLTWAELAETDWVTKSLEGLPPVRSGRFLVHGQHGRAKRRANDIAIEIEAGEAFGTGHHGTTVGCLDAIQAVARSRWIGRALDLGTGTGVLAIAIAKLTKARVLACDIDPVAATIARQNARLNGVHGRVRTLTAGGLSGRRFADAAPFDLIVANILLGPLVALAPAIRRHLAPGGAAVLSGLLPDERRPIIATYRGQGLRLVGSRVVDGWATVVMERRRRSPDSSVRLPRLLRLVEYQ